MPLLETIGRFEGEFAFLSNFYPARIVIRSPYDDTFTFDTVEHAYQAFKTRHPEEFLKVKNAQTPGEAKRRGQRVTIRPDWDQIKDRVMVTCVRHKFKQNEHLAIKLIETWPQELIEGNHWNDTYWGVCRGVGQNRLGLILMKIREELQNPEPEPEEPTSEEDTSAESEENFFDFGKN